MTAPTDPDPRLVQWAHQGGAKEAPSNTLGAFRSALMRAGHHDVGLELDVHGSDDGELVVIHDRTLERTTNGRGRVRRHSCDALQKLHAAWWWRPGTVDDHRPGADHPCRSHPVDADLRVPTLAEVLALRNNTDPKVPLTIEIKGWRAVRKLVEVLHNDVPCRPVGCRCPPPKGSGVDAPTITVTSFFDPLLWMVRWHLRRYQRVNINLAPGTGYMAFFWLRAMLGIPPLRTRYSRLQIPIHQVLTFATPRLVATARRVKVKGRMRFAEDQRLKVDVWTVDDAERMEALIRLGVDGIMTDCPSVLAGAVSPL